MTDKLAEALAKALPCIQRCAEHPHRHDLPPHDHFMACPASYRPAVAALMGEGAQPSIAEKIERMDAAECNGLEHYLGEKTDRSLTEVAQYLYLRIRGDNTSEDAPLEIVYERDGSFRRVLANNLRGRDILRLVYAVTEAPATPPSDPVEDRRVVDDGLKVDVGWSNNHDRARILRIVLNLPAPAREALRRLLGGGK